MNSRNFLSTVVIIVLLYQDAYVRAWLPPLPENVSRRGAFEKMASLTAGIVTATKIEAPKASIAAEDNAASSKNMLLARSPDPKSSSFDAYYLTPVENFIRSKLDKIESQEFLSQMAAHPGGSVWLGEHHNSVSDHNFQAMLIREVYKERKQHRHLKDTPMAVGLEQVQGQFQPILDDFVDGKLSLNEMKSMVQWDQRWTWSFENYREIFVVAKELGIRLLALNVDSEDLVLVEKEGYPGLPIRQLHKYIRDP